MLRKAKPQNALETKSSGPAPSTRKKTSEPAPKLRVRGLQGTSLLAGSQSGFADAYIDDVVAEAQSTASRYNNVRRDIKIKASRRIRNENYKP